MASAYDAITPYHFALNNPISANDPAGLWVSGTDPSADPSSASQPSAGLAGDSNPKKPTPVEPIDPLKQAVAAANIERPNERKRFDDEWRPFTSERLIELGEENDYNESSLRGQFQIFARKKARFEENEREFFSPDVGRNIKPDGVRSVWEFNSYKWRWKLLGYSSFFDASTAKGTIYPSTDNYQYKAMIDAISRLVPHGRGNFTVYTTSDTNISPNLIAYARTKGVALHQAKAYEWGSTGKVAFGPLVTLTGNASWAIPPFVSPSNWTVASFIFR